MWTVLFYPVDTVLFIHNVFSMVLREADLLFQNFHRILKLPVIFHKLGDVVDPAFYRGMIPPSQEFTDGLEGGIRHLAAQVHDHVPGDDDLL